MKNNTKIQGKAFCVWGICALFFLYEFLLRTVTGSYQNSICKDLSLNTFQFSLLSTTLFLTIYGLMQIPVGLIVDYFGLKKSSFAASAFCVIGCIGISFSQSFFVALFYRGLMGFGASFGLIVLLISVHEWMPRKYNGLFVGISSFLGTMGPMFAAGPLESLAHSGYLSWRAFFLYAGFLGGLICLLIFFFVENNHESTGKFIILQKPEKISKSLLRLFKKKQPWFIGVFATCLYFLIEYLSENEGRSFLILKGFSAKAASYTLTISWLGYGLGAPLLGWISDYIERRKILLEICSIISLISIFSLLFSKNQLIITLSLFFIGASASGICITYGMIGEYFKKQFIAVALSFNNALICIGSAINAPLIAFFLDLSSDGKELTIKTYMNVFSYLVILPIVCVIIARFFLKETFCKSKMDFMICSKE